MDVEISSFYLNMILMTPLELKLTRKLAQYEAAETRKAEARTRFYAELKEKHAAYRREYGA